MTELLPSLLAIATVLSSPDNSGEELAATVVNQPAGFCPRLSAVDEFNFIYAKTCPVERPFGFHELVFDPFGDIRYRCQDAVPPELEENMVHLLNSSTMLSMINAPYKDKFRRSWCMISMFYSPNCVFSTKLAPAFNAIPANFRNIRAVAIDATHFSRMNTRYGIAGTPTLILWVKGIPVARMEERELNVKGIAEFLHEWTDLESQRISEGEEGPLILEASGRGDFLVTLAAVCVLLLALAYMVRERILTLPAVEALLERIGTSSGQVNWFLSGM